MHRSQSLESQYIQSLLSCDKPSRLLAHQLRQSTASRVIAEINTSSGLTRDPRPQEIYNAFRNFYVSLYTSEQQLTTEDLLNVFANLSMPKLSGDTVENIDRPITAGEVGVINWG